MQRFRSRVSPLLMLWLSSAAMLGLAQVARPTTSLAADPGQTPAVRAQRFELVDAADLSTAELYDPVSGAWSETGTLTTPREADAATLLFSGQVLVQGGLFVCFHCGQGGVEMPLASAELYTPPTTHVLPPSCTVSAAGLDPSGHAFIKVAARDIASGLRSVQVVQASNASLALPSFPPSFREPAVVTATRVDQTQRSGLTLQVTNTAGQSLTCDPVVAQLVRQRGQPHQEVFRDLPQTESTLTLTNGHPGLEAVDVLVNGRVFRLDDLQDEQTRTLSVAAAMRPGSHNTIRVVDRGPLGSSAVLVISD